MRAERLKIQMRGIFAITGEDGRDLTPKSKKAVGLLAMVAEPETKIRNRRWLEDKLWTDGAPEKVQSNLRATLTQIRKALGSAAHVLEATRDSISLNRMAIVTDLDDPDCTREFLEGLDIPDTEFNNWLSEMRVKYDVVQTAPRPAVPKTRTISILCAAPVVMTSPSMSHAQTVSDRIGASIAEFIADAKCSAADPRPDLVVNCAVEDSADGYLVNVRVIDTVRDEILHSNYSTCTSLVSWLHDPAGFGNFSWNVADAALERLGHCRTEQSTAAFRASFAQRALADVLSFDPERMRSSLDTLDDAIDQLDDGLFLAMKAWSMMCLIMECMLPEDQDALDEIEHLLARAQAKSPEDTMVMALSATTMASLFGRYQDAMRLARRALLRSPNNILALQALSISRAAQKRYDEAYKHSALALAVAPPSKFEARCHLHHALLCLMMGNTNEALENAQSAADCSPLYRAPRRQLIALHALVSDTDNSLREVEALQSMEQDFSLERYLYDETYHTHTLRKTGHLHQVLPMLSGML